MGRSARECRFGLAQKSDIAGLAGVFKRLSLLASEPCCSYPRSGSLVPKPALTISTSAATEIPTTMSARRAAFSPRRRERISKFCHAPIRAHAVSGFWRHGEGPDRRRRQRRRRSAAPGRSFFRRRRCFARIARDARCRAQRRAESVGQPQRAAHRRRESFDLQPGDAFQVLTYGSATGNFASLSLPPLTNGLAWQFSETAANVTLRVVPEPEAASLFAFGGAALAMLVMVARRRGSTTPLR